ncbi:formate/nitrite transporter family protein [Candidatus Saccharibacteria bacterium]|nr:formate/nitrite transporter family protein [Candidatus Saccharibacteria bacterium]
MKKKSESPSTLIKKSVAASLLIGLGDYALLKLGSPLGPIIFAFGLLGVCYLSLNLFTGKCGFLFENHLKIKNLLLILVVNLISGYLIGLIFSLADESLIATATDKVATWDFSLAFFIKSVLCGVIMYLAVKMYKKGTPLGILFGIPLFIFCGFQHCIANVITLGAARTFDWSLLLCIFGNFAGSILIWYLTEDIIKNTIKKHPNATTNSLAHLSKKTKIW